MNFHLTHTIPNFHLTNPILPGIFSSPVASESSDEVDLSDDEKAVKLHCQYRKSCYETGDRAEISGGVFAGPTSSGDEDDDDEVHSEYQMKLKCRYRESCYDADMITEPTPKPTAPHVRFAKRCFIVLR